MKQPDGASAKLQNDICASRLPHRYNAAPTGFDTFNYDCLQKPATAVQAQASASAALQVFFEILMVGNLEEKSLFLAAIDSATLRATAL